MAAVIDSNSTVQDLDDKKSNDTVSPLTVPDSDAQNAIGALSPVHKRPKDDKSVFVRTQNADSNSNDDSNPEPTTMSSEADDVKVPEVDAKSMNALSKLVDQHSLKAVKFPVAVFVRIRPLVGKEVEDGHDAVNYTVKTSKKTKTQKLKFKQVSDEEDDQKEEDGDGAQLDEAAAKMLALQKRLKQRGRDAEYKGFRAVIEPQMDNVAMFERAVAPFISNVMLGQKTCVFAYGHTGSGKTHTIFGYPPDHPGMFELFAKGLFEELCSFKDISVEIRFTELYNKKIYDLLSADNRRCYLRENNGQFRLRADPVKGDDGKFRAYPVTGIRVRDIGTLRKVIAEGVGSRKCGESTLHDKSSRSHAFLEFEVVSKKLVEHRKEIVEYEANLLELQNNKAKLIHYAPSKLQEMEDKLNRMKTKEKKMRNDSKKPYVGGVINFVDLAGNEYGRDSVGKEDEQQLMERNEINQSLLALKECIRALNRKKKYVGFRGSELTKYLKRYLKGKNAHAVMLSHIGSSKEFMKQSKNTLQYAELVANASS